MATEKPAAHPRSTKPEHRRSSRFRVVVPVEVRWQGPGGAGLKEAAQARQVNAQGGLLLMKTYPEVGSRVELANFLSGEAAQARVLALRCSKEGEVLGVAVELVVPSESFWGANLQLKKTNAELLKLEQALKSGGVDLRILGEFRNAVDYVRMAAGTIQELQECQLQGRSLEKALSLLTVERIRRTTYLCNELATDLHARTATHDNKAMTELFHAVERIYQRLKPVRKEREPQHVLAVRR